MSAASGTEDGEMDEACLNILLIDDDPEELVIIQRVLQTLTDAPVRVDHVEKCSEAVRKLNVSNYDLVLLDNRLSPTISAEFSVPFIRSSFSRADVAIISNDVDVPYLRDPESLNVDYVVDKAKIVTFLREQVDRRIGFVAEDKDRTFIRKPA